MNINTQNLHRWITRCNQREDLYEFIPFVVDQQQVGAIHQNYLPQFQTHPEIFFYQDDYLCLNPALGDCATRTAVLTPVLQAWYQQGMFSGWRDEPYRVSTRFDNEPLVLIERAAASLFGIRKYGVHVNGLTHRNGKLHMWIGQRSRHSPTYPSQLDQLVAGGLGAAYSAFETVCKEAAEEANIPTKLAKQAKPVGAVSYCCKRKQNLIEDVLFVYDLYLPEDFVPENTDGEVEGFYCLSIDEVAERVAETEEFKLNTNLIVIDFLIRHAYLTPEMPFYLELAEGLRQENPFHTGAINRV